MPTTFRQITAVPVTAGESTFLTVPTDKILLVLEGWICNTHTAGVAVTIFAVENGSGTTTSNQIYADTVPAKRSVPFTIALNLAEGGTIRALASVANVVGLRLAPREIPE